MINSVIWSATRRGPHHIEKNMPNQDYRLGQHYKWGDVVVVADGVGSCPNSAIGSKSACKAAILAIKHCVQENIFDFERIIYLLHSFWLVFLGNTPPETAATTCLWAFTYSDKIYIASVGDGMIAACGNEIASTDVFEDTKEDCFKNETDCLQPLCSDCCWQTEVLNKDNYNSILLTTDGISGIYDFSKHKQLAYALAKNFNSFDVKTRNKNLIKLLKDYDNKGYSDDKTLICMNWR